MPRFNYACINFINTIIPWLPKYKKRKWPAPLRSRGRCSGNRSGTSDQLATFCPLHAMQPMTDCGISQYAANSRNPKYQQYVTGCQVVQVGNSMSECSWHHCGFHFWLGCPQCLRQWVDCLGLLLWFKLGIGHYAPVR